MQFKAKIQKDKWQSLPGFPPATHAAAPMRPLQHALTPRELERRIRQLSAQGWSDQLLARTYSMDIGDIRKIVNGNEISMDVRP
jgi:hypothetical protein